MMTKIKEILKKSKFLIEWYDRLKYSAGFIRERIIFIYDRLKEKLFPESEINKILFIRTAGLGDIIRLQVIVDKVKEKYPEAKISYFTSKPMVPLLKLYPTIDKIYTEEEINPLLEEKFDLVISTQYSDDSGLLKGLLQKIKAKEIRGTRLTPNENRVLYWRTWMEKWARIVNVPYRLKDAEKVYLPLSEELIAKTPAVFQKEGLEPQKQYIGICLGGEDALKGNKWCRNFSIKFLSELIEFLIPMYSVILTGKSSDREEREKKELFALKDKFPELIFLIDKLTLEELVVIIDRCSCYISSDTGPMHLALALKVPLIALFGHITGFEYISPKKKGDGWIIINSLKECVPCQGRIKDYCFVKKRALCMEELPLQEIKEAVKFFMG
ncbi:MAG: glycosyltransferase family 9 protein [bacterium]|nr:glycosyltransferase family 9 protein [bacterium]